MDVLDILLIALFPGLGIGFLIGGTLLLRRGDEVTAEEAVKWRRSARKQGFDASPDMNPDITDILVRAWRSWKGWGYLWLGIGCLLAGASSAVVWIVSGIGSNELGYMVLLFAALLLYPTTFVGVMVGLSRIRREQPETDNGERALVSPRLFRMPLAAWYPVVLLLANSIFMAILVFRLAPSLDSVALTHAFALPGMWSVPVVPAFLIVVLVSSRFVKRWILSLPPLYLRQDSNVGQRADDKLRQLAILQVYRIVISTSWMAAFFQASLLTANPYPNQPTIMAGLSDWFYFYQLLVVIAWAIATMIMPMWGLKPVRQESHENADGEGLSPQSQ